MRRRERGAFIWALLLPVAFALLTPGCIGSASFDLQAQNRLADDVEFTWKILNGSGDVIKSGTAKIGSQDGHSERIKLARGTYDFSVTARILNESQPNAIFEKVDPFSASHLTTRWLVDVYPDGITMSMMHAD